MTLITLNHFGLMLLGVVILLIVLVLALYMVSELRIVRVNQRKLMEAFGLEEDEEELAREVVYRSAK